MQKDGFSILFGIDETNIDYTEDVLQPSLFSEIEKEEISESNIVPMDDQESCVISQDQSFLAIEDEQLQQPQLEDVPSVETVSYDQKEDIIIPMGPKVVLEKKIVKQKSPCFVLDFSLGKKMRGWVKEARVFVVIFLVILSSFYFFTNAQLVFYTFHDVFVSVNAADLNQISETLMHNVADNEKENRLSQLESRFEEIQNQHFSGDQLALGMEEFVAVKDAHDMEYNILPPTNRLIIPDLNINVPLVDTEAHGRVDFSNENFDDELTKGVVKYPTTPTPGQNGNTLLFGHTSTEWWKKNDYGVVFRNIPKLKAGQRFQIVWNGQLTTYEMVERKVVFPKHVEEYYNLFADKGESYVTLMGCYPIGTANQRMMVVAKKVEA